MGITLRGHVEPYRRGGQDVKGRWRLVAELPGPGRQRKVETVDATGKRKAEEKLGPWLLDLERSLSRSADPTLSEVFVAWKTVRLASAQKPWRPKTRKFHETNWKLHIQPALGDRKARELQPSDLVFFYADLAQAGLGETSRHHVHATVRAMLNWALRNELVERNVALLIEEPPQQASAKPPIWTEEQVARAMKAAEGKRGHHLLIYVPLILGAWAGLRAGEVCALRWKHVDLKAGRVSIAASVSQTEQGKLHELTPKTAAGVRDVPLPSQAVAMLREHKLRQDEMRMARGRRWNREGYVICTAEGRPVKPSNLSSSWARFCKVHELPVIHFHGLRHSFATAIFEQGGEAMLKVVQELLGHSDPTITARTYLHATPAIVASVTEAQEARIAAAQASVEEETRKRHSSGTRVSVIR